MPTGNHMRTGTRRFTFTSALTLGLAVLAAGCDKVPLTAPSNSTLTISSSALVLPTGGTATLTATVIEPAGTPVQNGTTVRFTTTLGHVEPAEVQTRNGIATAAIDPAGAPGQTETRVRSAAIVGHAGPAGEPTRTGIVPAAFGAAAVAGAPVAICT